MPLSAVVILLAVPTLIAIATGCLLLKRALGRPERLPEEFAFAAAWVFVVGSLVWLGAFLSGSTLLGFGAPWTWLAVGHVGLGLAAFAYGRPAPQIGSAPPASARL